MDAFNRSSKVQGSDEGRKCSSIAFSPSVWKRPRLRMRSLAKSHVLSFDFEVGSSPVIAGQIKRGHSRAETLRNVDSDVDAVGAIRES